MQKAVPYFCTGRAGIRMVIVLFALEVFSVVVQRIFCEETLTRREHGRIWDFAVWGGYFVVFNLVTYLATESVGIAWINLLVFVLTFFITVRFLYEDSARTLVMATVIMYVSGMCAELLVYYGIGLLPDMFGEGSELLCTVLSKIVWFCIIKLVSLLVKLNKKMELNFQDWLEVFIVPVGSIWILLAIYAYETEGSIFLSFAAVLMILTINIFTYCLYDMAKEIMEKRIREEMLAKQCEYYVSQSRKSKEWWEELEKFRHDLRQHYLVEKAYLENRDYGALEKYCDTHLDILDRKNCVSNTGNIYVDSIINYKADVAEKARVSLAADLGVPKDALFNAEDFSICLGNLLDNAIEAAAKLESSRQVDMKIYVDKANLYINIKNGYCSKIHKLGERFLTSKADGRNHGMGLMIVRQVVGKYNGELRINDADGVFDVEVLLYGFLE